MLFIRWFGVWKCGVLKHDHRLVSSLKQPTRPKPRTYMNSLSRLENLMPVDRIQLESDVKQALWKWWDPICLNDEPAATGEYDSYAPGVISLLLDNSDAYAITKHLHHIERVSMGLPGNPERCDRVARQLIIRFYYLHLPDDLRALIDSETQNGNFIVETRYGWPWEGSIFVQFRSVVTSVAPDRLIPRSVVDPHYWNSELFDPRGGHLLAW
jgi:hypothetical protein